MTRSSPETPSETRSPAYRVEAPRATDAIGLALRGAFADEDGLPDDMVSLLFQLSRLDRPATH